MRIREMMILVLMSMTGGILIALGVEDRFEARFELWLAAASCVGGVILVVSTIKIEPKRGATRNDVSTLSKRGLNSPQKPK